MDMYAGFADRYDRLMQWDRRVRKERDFFKRYFTDNNIHDVLDCHCGTGFHLVMLSSLGYSVEGVDVSPEMVAVAKKNLARHSVDARIHLCDVKEMSRVLDRRYDCVISMGNSLPHEFGDDNLLKSLKNMYDVLRKSGSCIIHIENYDLLYRDRERFIPSVYHRSEDGVDVFIFAIDYYDDHVDFNILSVFERSGRTEFHADLVTYNPVSPGKLVGLMSAAGFTDVRLYEDFYMSPPGLYGTYDLIATAKKDDLFSNE